MGRRSRVVVCLVTVLAVIGMVKSAERVYESNRGKPWTGEILASLGAPEVPPLVEFQDKLPEKVLPKVLPQYPEMVPDKAPVKEPDLAGPPLSLGAPEPTRVAP